MLFEPLRDGADELNILSAYATPNMLSWYIKNIYHRAPRAVKLNLIVGMVPFDDLSVTIHEGFKQIVSSDLPNEIESIRCSYVIDKPAEHGKGSFFRNPLPEQYSVPAESYGLRSRLQ